MRLWWHIPQPERRIRRLGGRPRIVTGFTMIEMIMTLATVSILMGIMGMAVVSATKSIEVNAGTTRDNVDLAAITQEIMRDLQDAAAVTGVPTETLLVATVPDRTGDAVADKITYQFTVDTGTLTRQFNSDRAIVIADNLGHFQFQYDYRVIAAKTGGGGGGGGGGEGGGDPPPEPPPNTVLGYDAAFGTMVNWVKQTQIGTQGTLPIDATVDRIFVYCGGHTKKIRAAIYSDVAGEPGSLLVQSEKITGTIPDTWIECPVPATALAAGTYWVALAFENDNQHYYQEAGGQTRYRNQDAVKHGFRSSWGGSDDSFGIKVSIYAPYIPN